VKLSDKRHTGNEIRDLKKTVKELQEQNEALASALFSLYDQTNSLYGQLVIRGVLPDPSIDNTAFQKSRPDSEADSEPVGEVAELPE
jgi:hypothetical protein